MRHFKSITHTHLTTKTFYMFRELCELFSFRCIQTEHWFSASVRYLHCEFHCLRFTVLLYQQWANQIGLHSPNLVCARQKSPRLCSSYVRKGGKKFSLSKFCFRAAFVPRSLHLSHQIMKVCTVCETVKLRGRLLLTNSVYGMLKCLIALVDESKKKMKKN